MTEGIGESISRPAAPAESHRTADPVVAPHAGGRFYRPELDVVRFLAFLLVFLHHALPAPLNAVRANQAGVLTHLQYTCKWAFGQGLSLFFALSAYLICELLLREREATGEVRVGQFYIRRILRIWPLYFAGLAIGVVYVLVRGNSHAALVWTGWAVVLAGNWYVTIYGFPPNPLAVLWSISVEEQFYLIVPCAVKFLNRRMLAALSIVLILFANVWIFFLSRGRLNESAIRANSFVEFETFAAGILLCLLLHGSSPRFSAWLRVAFLIGWAASWYVAIAGFNIMYQEPVGPGPWRMMSGYALAALGCCFLLLAFLGLDRKFIPGWAIYMGRISYGLYVFHQLALDISIAVFPHRTSFLGAVMLAKGASAMALTVLFASLSYRYFETPFLKMKKRHEVIESRPV